MTRKAKVKVNWAEMLGSRSMWFLGLLPICLSWLESSHKTSPQGTDENDWGGGAAQLVQTVVFVGTNA